MNAYKLARRRGDDRIFCCECPAVLTERHRDPFGGTLWMIAIDPAMSRRQVGGLTCYYQLRRGPTAVRHQQLWVESKPGRGDFRQKRKREITQLALPVLFECRRCGVLSNITADLLDNP